MESGNRVRIGVSTTYKFAALFLLGSVTFAQRGGSFRASSPSGVAHATRSPAAAGVSRVNGRVSGHRSASRHRLGNGYLSPYPFLGDYGDDYLASPNYFPGDDNFVPPPNPPVIVQPPAPIQTAHAVVREYKWDNRGATPAEEKTFTIALKDGSQRSAVVTWVQGRTLHYTDPEDKQRVLSADLIDRDATRRLNREKNLNIQLPPG